MIECAFADASRPARSVILRLPMRDYSIGHELYLLHRRNPLLILSQDDFNKLPQSEQINAVMDAVLICSKRWDEPPMARFTNWVWRKLLWNTDWALAIADFRNYREQGSTMPFTKPPKEGGETLGGPHLARVLFAAGFDYDMPLGVAQWVYCCEMERQGCMGIKSDGEQSVEDRIGALKKEIAENPRGSVNIAQKKAREEAERKAKEAN